MGSVALSADTNSKSRSLLPANYTMGVFVQKTVVESRVTLIASVAKGLWLLSQVAGSRVAGKLASLGCDKARTGCHFRDRTLLRAENAIQCVRKHEWENRGQQIGVYPKRAVPVKSVDFH
jgi:hypothetical protein